MKERSGARFYWWVSGLFPCCGGIAAGGGRDLVVMGIGHSGLGQPLFHALIPSKKVRLWPQHLKLVFPSILNSARTRNRIADRFNSIRKLRNRVFHYEPIWLWTNLNQHHAEILEAIGWLSSDAKLLFQHIDRFQAVLTRGRASVPVIVTRP